MKKIKFTIIPVSPKGKIFVFSRNCLQLNKHESIIIRTELFAPKTKSIEAKINENNTHL